MNKLTKLIIKLDQSAPDPWIVDGVKQSRPTTQVGIIIGVIGTLIVYYFLF